VSTLQTGVTTSLYLVRFLSIRRVWQVLSYSLLFRTEGDDVMHKGGMELMEELLLLVFLAALKMQHMGTHPHHLHTGLLWLSVLTHWDSEIVPPTGDDLWLGSNLCWGTRDKKLTGTHRPAEDRSGDGRLEAVAK
jgi:hypothetical protein